MTDCIKIYKNYFSIGHSERFALAHGDIYDEFTAPLPEGAKLISVGIGDTPAIQLADGEICPDMYTEYQKNGKSRPYLIAVGAGRLRKIYLNAQQTEEN